MVIADYFGTSKVKAHRTDWAHLRPWLLKGGIQNELFKASYEEVQGLEDEVGILKQEEIQRLVVIRDVEAQRNRIARVAADTQRKVKLTEDDVAFKHVIVQDLKRTRKEVARRYSDFQQLYQLVKNQRNKFVSLVAVAGQGIGEFKEKVKILTNELEVSVWQSICTPVTAKSHHQRLTMTHDQCLKHSCNFIRQQFVPALKCCNAMMSPRECTVELQGQPGISIDQHIEDMFSCISRLHGVQSEH